MGSDIVKPSKQAHVRENGKVYFLKYIKASEAGEDIYDIMLEAYIEGLSVMEYLYIFTDKVNRGPLLGLKRHQLFALPGETVGFISFRDQIKKEGIENGKH